MPVNFPSFSLPSISLPSFGEIKAKFSAFVGKVYSALQSIGRRNNDNAQPIQSRSVAVATPPTSSPLKQLRGDIEGFSQGNLKHVDPKTSQSVSNQFEEAKADKANHQSKFGSVTDLIKPATPDQLKPADTKTSDPAASYHAEIKTGKENHIAKFGAVADGIKSTTLDKLNHVDPKAERENALQADLPKSQVDLKKGANENILSFNQTTLKHVDPKETPALSKQSKLEVQMTGPQDNIALRPAPLKTPANKPELLNEPSLTDVNKKLTDKWGKQDQKALANELSSLMAKLGKAEAKGATEEAAKLKSQIDGLADELGKKIGTAFKEQSKQSQSALALGSGGPLKNEMWNMLRASNKALPPWQFQGIDSEVSGSGLPKDTSLPKQFLDRVYTAALGQFDTHASPGSPPAQVTHDGKVYEPVKELGKGGQGTAYLYASKTGEQIVVKTMNMLSADDLYASDIENARAEYKAHFAMMGPKGEGHPNVLNVQGVARGENGLPIGILELAPGGDVKGLMEDKLPAAIAKGLVSPQAANLIKLELLKQSIEGMIHVQENQGARHADFKPGNLLLGKNGDVKVADFGLTTLKSNEISTQQAEGTPQYMAPEQYIPGSNVSGKADTWAVGVFAHELLHGERPFDAAFSGQMKDMLTAYKQGNADGARGVVSTMAENYDKKADVQGVSSMDRLLNAMLHPDADKRPGLSNTLESSAFDELGRGQDSKSPAVRELIAAITANPKDEALIKAKSDALGV